VVDLGRDPRAQRRGVEKRDRSNAALAVAESGPELRNRVAKGSDSAEAGDDNTTFNHWRRNPPSPVRSLLARGSAGLSQGERRIFCPLSLSVRVGVRV